MKKKIALLLVLVMAVSMLGACGGKDDSDKETKAETQTVAEEETKKEDGEKEDDEKDNNSGLFGSSDEGANYGPYVQSLLDLDYKGITDTYLELVDDTKENAESFYGKCMEYWAYILADHFLIVYDINEEVKADMIALTEEIFANVKYEVADAVKAGDGYMVEVTISPMLFVEKAYNEVVEYGNAFQERSDNGEFGDYENDEEAYTAREIEYANEVIAILRSYVSQIEYDEPVTKVVKITKDEDGLYGISDDDYADLENYLLY